MITRSSGCIALATCALLAAAAFTPASAAEPAEAPPSEHHELSKDTREKMAQLHEQMAACLRSDKSVATCHSEMMKNCQEQLGSEGCRAIAAASHGMDGRRHMQPNAGAPPR
jgi:hypothetical protein